MLLKTPHINIQQFKHALLNARKVRTPLFTLSIKEDTTLTQPHISCVVSKKVSPLAVVRNTLKRRGYAAFSSFKNIKPAYYIFSFKKESINVSYKELQDTMKSCV